MNTKGKAYLSLLFHFIVTHSLLFIFNRRCQSEHLSLSYFRLFKLTTGLLFSQYWNQLVPRGYQHSHRRYDEQYQYFQQQQDYILPDPQGSPYLVQKLLLDVSRIRKR